MCRGKSLELKNAFKEEVNSNNVSLIHSTFSLGIPTPAIEDDNTATIPKTTLVTLRQSKTFFLPVDKLCNLNFSLKDKKRGDL
jgi:hypothetical protein